ncbi:MAG: aminotransferase class I/II-fold pyridoxal phosphate-dependent enzyme [Lachnospiraceae bacterium]|nr:aminotransferase class I/II-fold pyridoxal phosphate-dependent enzyme [Lachnospiraceae bacterium]
MYPFHMPGHKRQIEDFPNPYSIDITEIEGFDNLHHPEDILLECENKASEFYGTKKTFYLINGSTSGLLTAVSAVARENDKVIVARNSHQAVYHAIVLRKLNPVYVIPEICDFGIQGEIKVESVEKALNENPDAKAVIVTSPTYEGIVSDIAGIKKVTEKYSIPLIVDEAHGAHFSVGERFPKSAIDMGADLVIQSLHKTLPSLTQTALLHLNSELLEEDDIRKFLDIYQTSSPSYVFMAGMEECIDEMSKDGKKLFDEYAKRLDRFYKDIKTTKVLRILDKDELKDGEYFDFDMSKIVISVKDAPITSEGLNRLLHDKYHLEMEMVSPEYVLAMTSVCDTDEGLTRLKDAILEIDRSLSQKEEEKKTISKSTPDEERKAYKPLNTGLPMHVAFEKKKRAVYFSEAIGKASGAFVYLYPPDIPLIVPGELITAEFVETIKRCKDLKMALKGLPPEDGDLIYIADF